MKLRKLPAILLSCCLPVVSWGACTAPAELTGKTFINKTASDFSPQNPNADSMFLLKFEKDRYTSTVLRSGAQMTGRYSYRRLAPTIGLMEAREDFGGQVTEFRLALVCFNELSGTIVYSQEKGAIQPDVRQNTGIYTIQAQ